MHHFGNFRSARLAVLQLALPMFMCRARTRAGLLLFLVCIPTPEAARKAWPRLFQLPDARRRHRQGHRRTRTRQKQRGLSKKTVEKRLRLSGHVDGTAGEASGLRHRRHGDHGALATPARRSR